MAAAEHVAEITAALSDGARGAADILTRFLRDEVGRVGYHRVVFGLSGGIDSAVTAFLAVRAFGAGSVFPLIMPYRASSQRSLTDAKLVLDALGLPLIQVDITLQIDAYFSSDPGASALRRGNKMARERMAILYDRSAELQALPLGTSNKTELLLGYGTQFGDLASAVNPLGDLYKSQVRALAADLGVPQSICDKEPSADLWADQTDEAELGFTYDEADAILYLLIDRRAPQKHIVELGFSEELVKRIAERVRANQYKRRPPVIAKLSSRTVGIDFRYPRDWGR